GDAAPLEVAAQVLRGARLVARRVDRVEPDQLLEEGRHLVAQGAGRHAPEHTSAVGDLFSDAADRRADEVAPLAQRLRPRTLDEFVGQEHVVGEGTALRLAIAEDRVPSLILYGPPGSGKT